MRAALVVVGGKDQHPGRQFQQLSEQAVVEGVGISRREIRPSGSADEQGISGEDPVVSDKAHGIPRVSRRMERVEPQLAHDEHVAIVQPDRKSVVSGTSVSVRVAYVGRRVIKKKQKIT